MENMPLKEAITILYDMELNNYLMTRAIQQLDAQIAPLGHKKEFSYPVMRYAHADGNTIVCGCVFGGIIGAILGLFVGCGASGTGLTVIGNGIDAMVGGGMIGVLPGALIAWGIAASSASQENEVYEFEFQNALKNYNESVSMDQRRVEKERKHRNILLHERDALKNRRDQAQRVLEELYMRVGIDKSYRSLLPIGKMNEIARLNITDVLEGPNGLNDRVRRELREDQFHHTLEEISSKLDVIISNQDSIYNELTAINHTCDRIVSETQKVARIAAENQKSLEDIVANTSVSAYNSERILVEERYRNMMMTSQFTDTQ